MQTKLKQAKLMRAELMHATLMHMKEAEASAPRAQDVLRSRGALGARQGAHLGARPGAP
jgi:hypothetical protein